MFTGIVEGTGKVVRIAPSPAPSRSSTRMTVDLGKKGATGLKKGQSVAVNGACLTVVARSSTRCDFEMIDESCQTSSKQFGSEASQLS